MVGDLFSFCSSFIDSGLQGGIELPGVMVEDEEMFSAFEEVTEEQLKRQKEAQLKRMKSKQEQCRMARMRQLSIDYKATKLYFKLLKESLHNKDHNQELILQITELIHHEMTQPDASQLVHLMCLRGLLMLMHNDQFSDFDWFEISNEILELFLELFAKPADASHREVKELEQHALVVQYLVALSKEQLHEYVMQLQSLITINIITGVAKMEMLVNSIRVLDILQWVNAGLREKKNKVEKKEFYNDAVNNNLDLDMQMAQWIKATQIQVRNSQKITHPNNFNLCSYHWIMSPHNKAEMIHQYNKVEWTIVRDFFLMRAFFDPNMRRNINSATQYQLEVNRANILDESLQKIVNVKLVEGRDQLKLPLSVRFLNEPAIDVGGVTKEYF